MQIQEQFLEDYSVLVVLHLSCQMIFGYYNTTLRDHKKANRYTVVILILQKMACLFYLCQFELLVCS